MQPPEFDGRGKTQQNRARRADETADYDAASGRLRLARTRPTADQAAQSQLAELAPADLTVEPPRGKPLKGAKARAWLTQQALARYAEGWPLDDIAEELGYAPSTVMGWILRHRRTIAVGQIDAILDQTLVPLAVDNLAHGLLAGDKDYTLKTLEGRGVLRKHSAIEATTKHELTPLTIRFEKPTVDPLHPVPPETAPTGLVLGAMAIPLSATGIEATGEAIEAELVSAAAEAAIRR